MLSNTASGGEDEKRISGSARNNVDVGPDGNSAQHSGISIASIREPE
jgi:hypothetical protein